MSWAFFARRWAVDRQLAPHRRRVRRASRQLLAGPLLIYEQSLHRNDASDANWLKRQMRFSARAENRGVAVTEAGSYLRLVGSGITQVKARGPSRTCNESNEEEEEDRRLAPHREGVR